MVDVMAISVSDIRKKVSDAIKVAVPDSHPSVFPIDRFLREPRALAHLAYAVGVPSTTAAQLDRQGPRSARQAVATTTVRVTWAYRLRVEAVDDYDAALDMEEVILAAVLAQDATPGIGVRFLRVGGRTTLAEGAYFTSTMEFEVLHMQSLSPS